MLRLTIKGEEHYNEKTNEFTTLGDVVIDLEHSLVSLSKWESIYEKSFLSQSDKTAEELFDYLRIMILTPDIDPDVLYQCSEADLTTIEQYINAKCSATTVREAPGRRNANEVITSELIYYWMLSYNIPFSAETWHLNRLFSLIRICNAKQSKPRKMSKHEIAAQNREINARRRQELGTQG